MSRNIIIIYKDKLESILYKIKDKRAPKLYITSIATLALSLLIAALSTKEFNGIPILNISSEIIKLAIWIIILLCSIALIVLIIRYLSLKNKGYKFKVDFEEIKENIIRSSEFKENDTLILLFPQKEKGVFKFPVQRKGSWGNSYFFPYISDVYNKEDISIDKVSIKKAIVEKYKLGAEININHLYQLDCSSTKLTIDDFPKKFNYRFILVSSKSPFFSNVIVDELEKENFEFLNLQQMLKDETTKNLNGDVVEKLNDSIHELNAAYSKTLINKSKIIWNIDKNCNKTCVFCAYGQQEKIEEALSIQDKKDIVDSLISLNINHIDFATGDNPDVEALKEIIIYSKENLSSNLSLTATSEVLEKLGAKFIKSNLNYIEITYDYPKAKQNKYRAEFFNKNNYNIAKNLINQGIKVEALVILYKNLKSSELKVVKNDLTKMGVKKVLLIRLMPVGKQKIADYPANLLKKNTYLKTMGIDKISNSENVSIHCSLKGLIGKIKEPCEMGNNKLGISNTGDVYTCPWAEHLQIEDNPFLIGNVLHESDSLYSLLKDSNNYNQIIENGNQNQPHCKIFSYINTRDVYGKSDKLYN